MENMKGFTVAIYPSTRKKLEIVKDEKEMTWDELFQYLLKIEKEAKNEDR